MANNFNFGMEEDDIEELTKGLLELEQECIAEEEIREKETAGEEKEPPRISTVKCLLEAFADLNKFLKTFKNMDPQH